jgi:hypothetical protein
VVAEVVQIERRAPAAPTEFAKAVMDAQLADTNFAAPQHFHGTIAPLRPTPVLPQRAPGSRLLWVETPAWGEAPKRRPPLMQRPAQPREVIIQGVTLDGKPFRPSDWAERLAGAMSSFRPGGSAGGISAAIGYSPYCVPNSFNNVKCVIVNEALRDLEPMAWDFVMNFARDNQLQVVDGSSAARDKPVN